VKVFLSYALSLAGLGVVLATFAGAFALNLSYPAARLRILNALRTSANQAELMCRTAKGTFYEPLGAAIKIAAMAGTTDLNILGQSTKPTYDATCMNVTMAWKKLFGRGKLAVLMVGGGLVLALSIGTSPILHILATVATVIVAIWFFVTRGDNERSLVLARAELLPEVDRAFAEGRYVKHG
jgi:hypothetical protein